MRTESVDARIAQILEKAALAKQHLKEAAGEADALPAEEAKEVHGFIDPALNHARAAAGSLRKMLEEPDDGAMR